MVRLASYRGKNEIGAVKMQHVSDSVYVTVFIKTATTLSSGKNHKIIV